MPAKKKPVAVLKSDGSRHYTKAELADRESREVQAPKTEKVNPPAYLDRTLVREFNKLAPVLVKMGVLSSVDGDVLGQYLVAKQHYVSATEMVNKALGDGRLEATKEWSMIQDRFFKQCRSCARELGLTVSARANIVLPQTVDTGGITPEEADMFGD